MKAFFALVLVAASVLGVSVDAAAAPDKITVAYFREWPTANQVAQAEKWYDKEMGSPSSGVPMTPASRWPTPWSPARSISPFPWAWCPSRLRSPPAHP